MQQRQQTGGRGKAYLFLAFSLITAVLAAVLVVQLLKRSQAQLQEAMKPKETVDVVVAKRNLYMGIPITEEDVAVRALSPEMVPADVVFTSIEAVLQRTPKERVLVNEIVRSERLARREAGIGLNAIITPGKRAVSVAIAAEEAVAGFIQPLNYVDVIVVIRPDDSKEYGANAVAKTLLQSIKVLAVGSSLGGPDEAETAEAGKAKKRDTSGVVKGKRTVTLEVTPEEAESIALASVKGEIVLALRADIDILQVQTNGMTANALIGFDPLADEPAAPSTTMASTKPRAKAATPAVEDGPKVQVIEGSTTTDVTINADGTTKETQQKGAKKR
ncbi:MAG: Flp pilus assembly protein CpaB [Deltaproteobacteria bacterium]|nr:Flp pilus assembly protein CpaB [Deltaproteobacteria bacterium]